MKFDGLQKQLKHLQLRVMDRVKIKGSSMLGTIIEIEKDINKIKWQGTRALFICVAVDKTGEGYFAPGQLKRVGSR